jgi:hypothetical protein
MDLLGAICGMEIFMAHLVLWVLLIGRSGSSGTWAFAIFDTEAECRKQESYISANHEVFDGARGDWTDCVETPHWLEARK